MLLFFQWLMEQPSKDSGTKMNYSKDSNQQLLDAFIKQFNHFHENIVSRPVASSVLHQPSCHLPKSGLGFEKLDTKLSEEILPNMSASNGGRYWGFVTGGANPIATYADWLVSTYNQNVSIGGDSIATSIELRSVEMLCELFDLPATFKGLFTSGATAANLLAAFTARQFVGHQQGLDIAKSGMKALEVSIYSATPHASMTKSLAMAGFGSESYIKIDCEANSESMQIESLENALKSNSKKGAIVIASAATVTGTDFDDFINISKLCKQYGAWLHVDAAFGIFERLISGKNGRTAGLELADSITLDCHKWLNVPYDCGVFLTSNQEMLRQSCEVKAPYLQSVEEEIPFMSLGIENSRRFRALPVWATLMGYGRDGIKSAIKKNIQQAKKLADWLNSNSNYLLVKACQLNVVLFKPNPAVTTLTSSECMSRLNQSGQLFLTPGSWQGEPIIRAAISNWSTSDEDIETAIVQLAAIMTNS